MNDDPHNDCFEEEQKHHMSIETSNLSDKEGSQIKKCHLDGKSLRAQGLAAFYDLIETFVTKNFLNFTTSKITSASISSRARHKHFNYGCKDASDLSDKGKFANSEKSSSGHRLKKSVEDLIRNSEQQQHSRWNGKQKSGACGRNLGALTGAFRFWNQIKKPILYGFVLLTVLLMGAFSAYYVIESKCFAQRCVREFYA